VIGIYAIGGGAGHVTRARRVIEALGIEAVILATPADPRAAGGIPLIEIPRSLEGDVAAHRAWMRALPYSRLIVDSFPCGIQGELSDFDAVPLDFISRLLRVEEYRRATGEVPWPQFETAYVVEEGGRGVEAARVVDLALSSVGTGRAEARPTCRPGFSPACPHTGDPGYWLIVHSGPAAEVLELVAYTQELRTAERVLVATPLDVPLPEGFERVDAFPVADLYPGAARIISAAGFNIMLETEPWREKHLVLPFPRRFDDQFARAARRRRTVLDYTERP
jgi:hypothetical protein